VQLWDSVVSTLTDPIEPDFVREFQESTLAQPVPPEFVETVVRETLKLPARVWRAVLLEGLLEADFSGELAKIQVPTLIFWGDQDPRLPEPLSARVVGDARGGADKRAYPFERFLASGCYRLPVSRRGDWAQLQRSPEATYLV
jgi:pimeloyl-ACP methyl ester carboxylesterase